MKKYLIKVIAAVVCLLPFSMHAHEINVQTAYNLLEIMQFDKQMDDTVELMVDVVKKCDPEINAQEEVLIREFYDFIMNSESIKDEVAMIYAKIFSEEELQDLIAFYMTDTGKKMLKKLPELMQYSMDFMQTRIAENIGELEKKLEECRS